MDPGSEIENEEGLGLIHWSPAKIFFTWTTSLKILDSPLYMEVVIIYVHGFCELFLH